MEWLKTLSNPDTKAECLLIRGSDLFNQRGSQTKKGEENQELAAQSIGLCCCIPQLTQLGSVSYTAYSAAGCDAIASPCGSSFPGAHSTGKSVSGVDHGQGEGTGRTGGVSKW